MHYAKVVGIFQTLHPGRTTISVLQGLGYFLFFFIPVSFKCVISLSWSSGYELHRVGKDKLGPGQGIIAWPLVSAELSKMGIHQMEEQQCDPTRIFGCRKNLWGWRGAEIRAGSGD